MEKWTLYFVLFIPLVVNSGHLYTIYQKCNNLLLPIQTGSRIDGHDLKVNKSRLF